MYVCRFAGHDHTLTVGNPAQAGSPQTCVPPVLTWHDVAASGFQLVLQAGASMEPLPATPAACNSSRHNGAGGMGTAASSQLVLGLGARLRTVAERQAHFSTAVEVRCSWRTDMRVATLHCSPRVPSMLSSSQAALLLVPASASCMAHRMHALSTACRGHGSAQ